MDLLSPTGAYQASSTSSEQKAGPIAIISPIEPAGGGSAMLARSTSSTDTEDRLPLLRNEFRVWSRALPGRSNTFSTASITRGPPGWHTQVDTSSGVSPWSARNPRTSSPRYFSVTVATSTDKTIRKPSLPIFQPMTSSVSG